MSMSVVGTNLEPVRIQGKAVPKPYGGTRLGEPVDGVPIGEVWTISSRPEATGIVASGPYAGRGLDEFLRETGAAGIPVADGMDFPVLVKKIEVGAGQCASIQVHPDDEYARAHGEPFGKDELWVYDEPGPNAFLYYGVEHELTPDEFAEAIEQDRILECLHRVKANAGDVFFNTSGTIHASGETSFFWEIQQNSDTTYRVYDYRRQDAQGNFRPLHIEQAKEVALLSPSGDGGPAGPVEPVAGGTRQLLGGCKSFATWRYTVEDAVEIPVEARSFVGIIVTDGSCELSLDDWADHGEKDDTFFVPAQDATLCAKGACQLLVITLGA